MTALRSIKISIIGFLILFGSLPIYSQVQKIIYIFPDNVEVAVNSAINVKTKEKVCHYLVLRKDTIDTYNLIVSYYLPSDSSSDNSGLSYRIENSDRMAVINDKQYPLLFDYDYRFGTKDAINIGEYGKRDEGFVLRTMIIYDAAYTIHFRSDGTILKEGYY